MKSPFPGMDPYIEACGYWPDFHNDLMAEIKRALAASLPRKYRVRLEQREVIELVEEEGKSTRAMVADVSVTGPLQRDPGASVAVAEPLALSEPLTLRAFVAEEFRERFVEILTAEPERRLVTCIEVLSPSNKRPNSSTRERYLRKRQAVLLGETHLVELDLLRGGARMPMVDPWPVAPYTLLVGRWYREGLCHVWRASHREPLPSIPIPLDRPDPDVMLHLQPMIDAIYERSRYGEDIDYAKPLDPPLPEVDQSWLRERLAARTAGTS